jgi:hypothetical protein
MAAETRTRGTCRCKGFDDRVFWDSCGTCQRRRAEAAESRAAALEAERDRLQGNRAGHPAMCCGQCSDALAAAESLAARRGEALRAAASSLEWIAARRASSEEGMTTLDVLMEVRAYANSRATVARAALSESAPETRGEP